MPVLKIKKNGSWVEVWGALSSASGTLPKLTTVSIPASGWGGSVSPYSQVVTVSGVNANSKLDLQPTSAQIAELQDADISLMASNNNGVVTVYAFGGKPSSDYEMQMLITDVEVIA
jgi:hypothetical protein